MAAMRDRMLSMDRRQLDLRAGVVGVVVVAVLAAVIALWGPVVMAAVVGALVMLVADAPAIGRSWITALVPVGVGGTVVTFAGVAAAGHPLPAALLVGAVAVVAALHAGRSHAAGVRSLVASIWVILAVTLPEGTATPVGFTLAFAAGAVVGGIVTVLRARSSRGADGSVEAEAPSTDAAPAEGAAKGSDLAWLSGLSGVGLAAGILVGFTWFPAHPAWVAITSLLVMRPPLAQALMVGVQRSVGTAVGVLVAVAVSGVVGENTAALVVLFLASAFLMMAVREANYALFAVFVTTLVVYLQRLLGEDASESGAHRLIETAIGVLIAFGVLGVNAAIARARNGVPS